ncbi:VanZ family protein [Bacillus sp. HMF5848]|nr:VanZ family protein [Bacillus sp. HMF5848]
MLVLIWMVLIFNLSAQPASQSNSLSKGVTKVVVETVDKVTSKSDLSIDTLNHYIRKNAHFFIYLVLAVLVLNALRAIPSLSKRKRMLITIGICVLYAITDEIHQTVVPGRGPQIKDIVIDSLGAATGIGIYQLLSLLFKPRF